MTVVVSRPAEGIAQFTLDRPGSLNTLNREMTRELAGVLTDIDGDVDCRVVVLTGSGRAFCAGLDLTGYLPEGEMVAETDPLGRA